MTSVYGWELYGQHPVDIGDVINERYRILYLLGEGSFSMVWLAEDLEANTRRQPRLVSLKICAAGKVHPDQASPEQLHKIRKETELLHRIESLKKRRPSPVEYPSFYPEGGKYIVSIYDEFLVTGANGTHQCIVMEFCGPSLSEVFRGVRGGLPKKLAQRLAVQLAQAVAFLQGCNIGHGDLHSGNLLLCPRAFRTWGPEDLKIFGEPDYLGPGRVPGPPHGPKRAAEPINSGLWVYALKLKDREGEFPDIELRVTDFGQSFISQPPPPPHYMGIPPPLAAPEVLIRKCILHASVPPMPKGASKMAREDLPQPLPDHLLTDPEHNPFLKALSLPDSSPLLQITLRSDLWSLGGTLFHIFEYRDSLFADKCDNPEDPEIVLYELGLVYGVETFLKVKDVHTYKAYVEPSSDSIAARCKRSLVAYQPVGLVHTIEKLLKIMPKERCEAVQVIDMLHEVWPHLKPVPPTTLDRIWAFVSLQWFADWLLDLWDTAMAARRAVVKRIRSGASSVLGLGTGGVPCVKAKE